jgi:hypothetical protein
MPFDLAELSVEESRSSDRIMDEAECSDWAVWGTLDLQSGGTDSAMAIACLRVG